MDNNRLSFLIVSMRINVLLSSTFVAICTGLPTKQSLVDLESYNDYDPLIEYLGQVFERDIPASDTYIPNGVDIARFAELDYYVAMSPPEMSFFEHHVKNATAYFEFGAGGSTRLACNTHENLTIFSVDSNLNYLLGLIQQDSCVRDMYNREQLFLYIADIGVVREWGYPIYNHTTEFAEYSKSILVGYNGNLSDIDLVLVDGRFRVACILQALLVTSRDTVILVHDFFFRPEYFIVLLYVDVVGRVDTMAALKRKRGMNHRDFSLIRQHLEFFRVVPA